MRRVHKDLARTVSAIISLSMVTTVALTACTVNMSRLNDGLNELSDSISDIADNISGTEITLAPTETTIAPTEDTEATTEALPTATPAPTATPTATPTPTPKPERVDFSFLTDEEIGNSFKVYKEEYKESGLDSRGNAIAETSGVTIRVECENKNIQEAVNCILRSFSKRADGAFASYFEKAQASAYLTGLANEKYLVTQDMAYSDNGRLLSVVMHYEVTGPDGVCEEATDYATFDMLTGQFITIPQVSSDQAAFEKVLGEKLLYAYMNPVEGVEDDGDKIDQNTPADDAADQDAKTAEDDAAKDEKDKKDDKSDRDDKDSKKDKDDKKAEEEPVTHDVKIIFIAAQKPGAQTATAEVYGLVDGNLCHTTVDLNSFESYLNSFGKIVFMVGQE